ncbi:hypothetical protein [Thermus tenuipuniceus]|uniref:hypothetical protein n=1 Tax=Thermus tenuipuniceus TaxID=2078690 RepID=UPI003CC68405
MVRRAAARALGSIRTHQIVEALVQKTPLQKGVHLLSPHLAHPLLDRGKGKVAPRVKVFHPQVEKPPHGGFPSED